METYIVMSVISSVSIIAFLLCMKFVARIESLEDWNIAVFFLAIASIGIPLSQVIPAGYAAIVGIVGGIMLAEIASATITARDRMIGS